MRPPLLAPTSLLTGVASILTLLFVPSCPATAADDALEEIVVTARKRAENLQTVPDSVTAFSTAEITERRLTQINDFLALTPNVHLVNDQDPATNIISIRGIGSNRNEAAAVAFAVDGVILPDSDAFTTDLSDAQQVEVLKGPQGALYGKGAIAGAINITTFRPGPTLDSEMKASGSTGSTERFTGRVSGPLVSGQLAGSLTATYFSTDGTIINDFDGRGLDYEKHYKTAARLIWTPLDGLTIDWRGSYYHQRGSALWFSRVDALGTTGGEITSSMSAVRPDLNGPHSSKRTIGETATVISYETSLGTLSSISAYDDIKVDFREDLDQTSIASVPDAHQTRSTKGFSEELRLSSPDQQPLRYIVGAYFQHTRRDVVTNATLDYCYFGIPVPGPCTNQFLTLSGNAIPTPLNSTAGHTTQYAGFGQINYDIVQNLELTAALRYDRVNAEQLDLLSSATDAASFDKVQPKGSLAYKITPTVMTYATYSEGFKSGTFNPPPLPGSPYPLIVQNESSRNYEIGAKTQWLDRTVQVNAALFHTDYRNPQIFQLDVQSGGQVTINARKVRIQGGELDVLARVAARVDLNASFGLTDSRIRDFDGSGLYLGQPLPNMPRSQLNLGAAYHAALSERLTFKMRADYFRTGSISFQDFQNDADPDHYLHQLAYSTIDAQVGLEGNHWSLTAFGRNLGDRHYATSAYSRYIASFIFVPLGVDLIQKDPGRIVGAELRYHF